MEKHLTEPFHTKKNSSLVSASMSTSASMVHFLSVVRAHVNHVLYDPETKLIYCNRFFCPGRINFIQLQWFILSLPTAKKVVVTNMKSTLITRYPHAEAAD